MTRTPHLTRIMEAYKRPGTGRPTFYFGRALGQESSASDIFVTIRERLHGS